MLAQYLCGGLCTNIPTHGKFCLFCPQCVRGVGSSKWTQGRSFQNQDVENHPDISIVTSMTHGPASFVTKERMVPLEQIRWSLCWTSSLQEGTLAWPQGSVTSLVVLTSTKSVLRCHLPVHSQTLLFPLSKEFSHCRLVRCSVFTSWPLSDQSCWNRVRTCT